MLRHYLGILSCSSESLLINKELRSDKRSVTHRGLESVSVWDYNGPGQMTCLEWPHSGLRPLVLGPSKHAKLAGSLRLPQGHSKTGELHQKGTPLGWTFLYEWSHSTTWAVWTAGVSREGLLTLLKWPSASGQPLPGLGTLRGGV